MKLTIIESPYAGDVTKNLAYARAVLRDSLLRGEAPLASHVTYAGSGALDDAVPVERQGLGVPIIYRTIGWPR